MLRQNLIVENFLVLMLPSHAAEEIDQVGFS